MTDSDFLELMTMTTVADAAEELGVTRGTITSRQSKAFDRLAKANDLTSDQIRVDFYRKSAQYAKLASSKTLER